MVSEERGAVRPVGAGGDAACWLGELCPECGAVPEGEEALDPTVPCWRCGTARTSSADGE